MERYRNKRVLFRAGGRFAKAPSLESLGFQVAHGEMECANCHHRWYPVLVTGLCPNCGATDKVPSAPDMARSE